MKQYNWHALQQWLKSQTWPSFSKPRAATPSLWPSFKIDIVVIVTESHTHIVGFVPSWPEATKVRSGWSVKLRTKRGKICSKKYCIVEFKNNPNKRPGVGKKIRNWIEDKTKKKFKKDSKKEKTLPNKNNRALEKSRKIKVLYLGLLFITPHYQLYVQSFTY